MIIDSQYHAMESQQGEEKNGCGKTASERKGYVFWWGGKGKFKGALLVLFCGSVCGRILRAEFHSKGGRAG